MKQILSVALFLCSFVFSYSQSSAPIRPAAKLNVSVATGSDPYTLTVSVLDDLSRFSFADFGVGDSVYLIDGSDLLIYVVTSKLTSPNRLVVDDVNNTGISAPTGQGAIVKSTANYKLPFYISGLRDDLRSMMMNRFSQLLDGTIYTAGNEIYRYLGSTGVAPAVTAAVAGATTAQNTVGEIYTWNPSTNLSSGAWSIVSGGGGGLTPNSVDSTHIKLGGIAASDLSQHIYDTLQFKIDSVGSLISLTSDSITTLVPTVAKMKTLKRSVGAVVNTQGFYSPNDGGGARYVVQTTGTADDKTTFLMADGKYAKLQTNADNGINLLQLGAKLSDGIDDKPYIQTAIDSFNYVYCQQVGDLSVHSHFQIKSGLHLKFGNNTTLKTDGTTSDVFIVSNNVAIDSNVVIEGGIWDRVNGSTATGNIGNIYGKPSIYLYGLTFRKIKRLTIRDMKVINVPKFAISIADFEDITIDNVVFNTNSDGIHLMGAGKHVLINNIYGHTGDDFIAVSGSDYSSNNDTKGDIEDVTITNIHPTKSHGNAISLFPGNNGSRNLVFKNITINDVKGDVTTANVIRVYSDGNAAETTGGVIDGLTISDVSAKTVDGNFIFTSSIDTVKNIKLTNFHPQVGRNPIKFVSGYFDNVTIDGVYNNKMTETAIIIDSIAKIDNLLLNDIKLTNTNALNIPFIAIDTSLYKKMDLTLTNSSFKSTTANTGYLQFSRDSANYKLNNVSFEKGLWGVRIVGKGNKLHLDNVDFSKQSTYGVASFNSTTVDLYTRSFIPPLHYSYSFSQNSPSRMIHKEYKTIVFDSTATDRGFTSDLLEGTIFDLKNIAISPILMYGDLTINGASTYSQPAGTTVRYRKVSATNWVTETDFNMFSNASRWSKTGDAGTNSATNFIGTTDNVNFIAKVKNAEVFRLNQSDSTFSTLKDVLINSVKVGTGLGSIVTNTAVGNNALITNTTGTDNTAIGRFSLRLNTTGSGNVGLGSTTLSANTTGGSNLAIGSAILSQNTTGSRNIGIGSATLDNNTTGSDNVAIGSQALINNLTTSESIAIGTSALQNSVNTRNTAVGYSSLFSTTSGSSNVAIGHFAGYSNTTGLGNIFIGRSSDATAGTYSNSIVIGHQANITASNQIVLGNASTSEVKVNGITGGSTSDSLVSSASGVLKRTTINDMLGTTTSSLRIPRLTTTQRDALNGAAGSVTGDVIYNSTTGTYQVGSPSSAWLDVNTISTIKVSNDPVAIPSITGMTTGFSDQTVTGAAVGNTVIVNPRTDITADNVILGGCYVVSTNTVRILFFGTSVGTNGAVTRNFDITVSKN